MSGIEYGPSKNDSSWMLLLLPSTRHRRKVSSVIAGAPSAELTSITTPKVTRSASAVMIWPALYGTALTSSPLGNEPPTSAVEKKLPPSVCPVLMKLLNPKSIGLCACWVAQMIQGALADCGTAEASSRRLIESAPA